MLAKIVNEIKKYDTIIIIRHQNPDPDAIGSQTGLANILQETFPEKKIFTPGTDLPVFDWIAKMQDTPADTYQNALVIAVDTANSIRIDDEPYYQNAAEIIKIDHHPNVDPFGNLNWVDETFSSCAEMIFTLAEESGYAVSQESGRRLYSGIIGDTNRFLYAETSTRTLEIAAKLSKLGVNVSEVGHAEDQLTLSVAKLEAYMLENFTLTESGFGYIILNKQILDIFNLAPGELDSAVPLIGKINTVKTWAILSEKESDKFRVNLRSKVIPINQIASKFGGGGHPLASGVFVHGMDCVNQLLDDMDKTTQEN